MIECTGYEVDKNNRVLMVKAKIFKDSKSGTKGSTPKLKETFIG